MTDRSIPVPLADFDLSRAAVGSLGPEPSAGHGPLHDWFVGRLKTVQNVSHAAGGSLFQFFAADAVFAFAIAVNEMVKDG